MTLADAPLHRFSPRRRPVASIVIVLGVLVLLSLAALPRLERAFMAQSGYSSAATLELATQVLRGAISRTDMLPALIAERPILQELLRDPANDGLLPFVNEQLRQSALALDVSDIYLMDRTGLTIAASSYRTDRSFVGRRFAFRPYFIDAMSGGLGRFHALGTTSGERGYFVAAPVIDGSDVIGAVAVKTTMDRFEEVWAESDATLIVTDSANVIFMSDRRDWHFRTFGALPDGARDRIAATQQYPLDALDPLPLTRERLDDRLELIHVDGTAYVGQTDLVATAGWRVTILTPIAMARLQAYTVLSVIGLTALFAALVAATIWQRRISLIQRLERQRGEKALLETRVTERTRDLDRANAKLRLEVDERRRAEAQLRKTQADLVQAGKLAALGQMSAALSHEFNQPLAAVKAYAENAGTFLDRGRLPEARDNITRISGMADRMARISKHLRNFARRPQDATGPIPIRAVIRDALDLMQPRLEEVCATLHYTPPEAEIWVIGGRVRLQQVIVNLIGNALDAMSDAPHPEVTLTLHEGDGTCELHVADRGPGLSEDALTQAFDPFFTTKDPGKGLGLGLSISYNIVRDFNGRLKAMNAPGGGAVFVVSLELTEAPAGIGPETWQTE